MIPISIPTKCHRNNFILQQKYTNINQQNVLETTLLLQQAENKNNNSYYSNNQKTI